MVLIRQPKQVNWSKARGEADSVSRLLLLFICLIWIAGVSEPGMIGPSADLPTVGIFLAPFALVVVIVALWSRWIARRLVIRSFSRTSHTLNWLILASRGFVVTWFGAGVFTFGWAGFVMTELHGGAFTHARLPGLLLGTLPAFLAWIGLWWAQYPAEHALRQQSMIENLVDELPIHRPPTLAAYVTSNLRLQLLFTVLPVILIAAVHDTAAAIVLPFFDSGIPEVSLAVNAVESNADKVDGLLWLLSAGSVFVLAPEVLRRILQTTPMQDGPLRRRLEALSERSGIRCRDILVWHTHFNVGNAAVMGLLPRYRYVLLSDLLLERMDDDQIEAVLSPTRSATSFIAIWRGTSSSSSSFCCSQRAPAPFLATGSWHGSARTYGACSPSRSRRACSGWCSVS